MVVVLSPEANEEQAATTVNRLNTVITERGGIIGDREDWGVRRLAYPIKKFQEGNYVMERFTASPAAVVELARALDATEEVIRHLVTRV